jgi:hypothetical protein
MGSLRARAAGSAALIAAVLIAGEEARAQGPAPDAAVDCAAAFNEAGALRDRHDLKKARDRYQVCSLPACPSFVAMCASLSREVSAAIPSLVLQAKDPLGSALVAVTVTLDGAPFATSLDGTAIEVNPGKHELRFEAVGYQPVTKDVVVVEGKKDQVDTTTLQATARPSPPPAPSPPPITGPAAPPPREVEPPTAGAWSSRKSLALVAGGVGVAGLVVGSFFGLEAGSSWSRAKSECQTNACGAGSPAQNDRSSALNQATVSTVLLVAGGLVAAGGAVLWLTAPTGQAAGATGLRVTPTLGTTGAGVSIGGGF